MNAPITVTATLHAWCSSQWRLDNMLRHLREGDHTDAADELSFSIANMAIGENPWIRVGEAQVTVTLLPQDALVAEQLRSLQAELDHARAEWLTKQRELMERISKLQALTNEVPA